jgi:hypothetical protein
MTRPDETSAALGRLELAVRQPPRDGRQGMTRRFPQEFQTEDVRYLSLLEDET